MTALGYAMNDAKKATLEKYGVVGLLLVFALIFSRSLKSLGILGGSRAPATPGVAQSGAPIDLSKPIGQTLQEHWSKMDPLVALATPPAAKAPASAEAGPVYTAQTLRDPLKKLLPAPTPPVTARPAGAADGSQAKKAAVKPPVLTVQGLWWGQTEPRAIINGNVYAVGDTVEGAMIRTINRDGVLVEFGGTTIHLVPEEAPKKPAGPRRPSRRAS